MRKNLRLAKNADILSLSEKAQGYYQTTDEYLFVGDDGLYYVGFNAHRLNLTAEGLLLEEVNALFEERADEEPTFPIHL